MNNNKVDKDFQLVYWKLSYRRKFIRTLWMTPFAIISITLMFLAGGNILINTVLSLLILVMYFIQLIYTYAKWKKDKQSS
jgi:hypothetical protein